MSYQWPSDTKFKKLELVVEDRECPVCGRRMVVCDHRHHRVHSFSGPVHLLSRLVRCADADCQCYHCTFSPEAEYGITMPWWIIDWEVFAWIGQRRFARHWSVPQIRAELEDSYQIDLSEDAIENTLQRYQTMLAAREQDPKLLAEEYRDVEDLVLSIDGLQPEKGHETLYVVRELRGKRVWFAESLISSSAAEVRRLLVQTREWAERLGLGVRLWISDKQEAFVSGIREEFPGVPHRYCDNHFLRDLAKPVLEEDSHSKVKMRKKVRGLRSIERSVLEERERRSSKANDADQTPGSEEPGPANDSGAVNDLATAAQAGEVVLDYCSGVRGILNNDQGGPLEPPGLRMSESLRQVRASLQKNLDLQKGALRKSTSRGSQGSSTVASKKSRPRKDESRATSKRSVK